MPLKKCPKIQYIQGLSNKIVAQGYTLSHLKALKYFEWQDTYIEKSLASPLMFIIIAQNNPIFIVFM